MNIEVIRPNLYRIPVPLPGNPLRELNSYLIQGEERSLLIDTGFRMDACRDALFAALAELKVDRSRLDVVLTHLHADHTGLGPEVITGDGVIYLSRPDYHELIECDETNDFFAETGRFYGQEGFTKEQLDSRSTNDPAMLLGPIPSDRYRILEEDCVLTAGDYSLKPILVPGHTPGQMCFWMEDQEILFTGDHVLFDITPNICAWPSMPNSLGQYRKSLDRIRSYAGALALPGHRGRGDLITRIDSLQEHHEKRLEETLRVVRSHPGMNAYQIAGEMTWKIRSRNWAEFPIAQKWFAVGECLSHLEYLMAEGLIRREIDEDGRHYR